jgi:hypothetical protein
MPDSSSGSASSLKPDPDSGIGRPAPGLKIPMGFFLPIQVLSAI